MATNRRPALTTEIMLRKAAELLETGAVTGPAGARFTSNVEDPS